MKAFKTYIFIILCGVVLYSCKKEDSFKLPEMSEHEKSLSKAIIGDWTEFTPFNANKPKSFSLKENGEATSVNMINNEYKNWWVQNHELLVLSNKDTLRFIVKATSENIIVLEKNNQEFTYKRVDLK
ncbi:lipocalin family protein [Myroides odoratimimus]|uniref:lipocalin family protein n=1 Tax=Myroides odoratimimus TaxID=76832 RepID=UPI003100FA38